MDFITTRVEFTYGEYNYIGHRRPDQPWCLARWGVDNPMIPPYMETLYEDGWWSNLLPAEGPRKTFPHLDGIREYLDPLGEAS